MIFSSYFRYLQHMFLVQNPYWEKILLNYYISTNWNRFLKWLFSESVVICFSHFQNKYSKSLSWAWNLNAYWYGRENQISSSWWWFGIFILAMWKTYRTFWKKPPQRKLNFCNGYLSLLAFYSHSFIKEPLILQQKMST